MGSQAMHLKDVTQMDLAITSGRGTSLIYEQFYVDSNPDATLALLTIKLQRFCCSVNLKLQFTLVRIPFIESLYIHFFGSCLRRPWEINSHRSYDEDLNS